MLELFPLHYICHVPRRMVDNSGIVDTGGNSCLVLRIVGISQQDLVLYLACKELEAVGGTFFRNSERRR